MSMLEKRNLPELMRMTSGEWVKTPEQWPARREELVKLFGEELFGVLPEKKWTCTYTTLMDENVYYHGGDSILRVIGVKTEVEGRVHEWKFQCSIPKKETPVPLFVVIDYERLTPLGALPIEEICTRGYAIATVAYQQVATDDGDFGNGLGALFYPDGVRGAHAAGKIALWAFAMQRALDELLRMPEIDKARVIAAGHSRLGKTALWAAISDDRFTGVISNDSGCAGASLARGNTGEQVHNITTQFPYWFAPAYAAYAHREEEMPFDQHMLLAAMAPNPVYVASAAGDLWADPLGEYLSCLAAAPAFKLFGYKVYEEEQALGDDVILHDGRIGYHRRKGSHYFRRMDWLRMMDFFDKVSW